MTFVERYSEDQPRDDDGKWTDGGGGDGSGDGGSAPAEKPKPESDIGVDGAYNDKGQWGEGPLLDQKPKNETIETGETKKKEKIALVYASTPIPKPHPQGGYIVQYKRSYAVYIRKGHYDGKVPGGIRYSWFVHKQYLSRPDAEKIFARRTKKKEFQVQYSTEKVFGQSGDLIRAKRDRNGDVILYVDAIALDYVDQQQGIKEYLNCFTRYSEDQPRDEDGKWTDGGGSDSGGGSSGGGGSSQAVVGYKPGVKAPSVGTETVKHDWIKTSQIKTIDDAAKVAGSAQQSLATVGRVIQNKFGVRFSNPGTKIKHQEGLDRVAIKAAQRGGKVAAVTDIARASFVIDKPGQADAIISELGKHFEVTAEPWKVTDVNYADRTANVRFANGLIGEVQFMDSTMAAAKSPDAGAGHDLYKIARDAAPNGPKPDAELYTKTMATMTEHYGRVLDNYSPEWKAVFGKAGSLPKAAA